MTMEKDTATSLATDLEDLVRRKISGIFNRYGLDTAGLVTQLKWKPIVLVIGNYSSGKSTFINELLGAPIQRTGQSPTDDSFTVITAPGPDEPEGLVPGGSVVGDERLPFAGLRRFGEKLISHLQIRKVRSPIVEEIALIDTPGMLDSVTEMDRGYDYLGVIGEIAKVADLIILMFDPHKAGTIKETYQAIRGTLPAAAGEERVLYVLNRIDECANVPDLVRAYGTLCWNLSQMTGRKDVPRIFLTFSPQEGKTPPGFEIWIQEREELKKAVSEAPRMRLNHILQVVDTSLRGAELVVEAMASWKRLFWKAFGTAARYGVIAATAAFLFGDVILSALTGYPERTFLGCMATGDTGTECLFFPAVSALLALTLTALYVQRILVPRLRSQAIQGLDGLVDLDTAYKKDLWDRMRGFARRILENQAIHQIWIDHGRSLSRIREVRDRDLARLFQKVL